MTRKRESSTEDWVEGLRREREEREESLMTTVEKRGRGRPKKVVHRGLHKWRYKDNALEKRFADEWAKLNDGDRGGLPTLLYLLAADNNRPVLEEMSARDAEVAATVIQWLGSPVGSCWLAETLEKAGYEMVKKTKKKDPRDA
jgi:hypothetical protein